MFINLYTFKNYYKNTLLHINYIIGRKLGRTNHIQIDIQISSFNRFLRCRVTVGKRKRAYVIVVVELKSFYACCRNRKSPGSCYHYQRHNKAKQPLAELFCNRHISTFPFCVFFCFFPTFLYSKSYQILNMMVLE